MSEKETDIERYDRATTEHARSELREYKALVWALASAAYPSPLRVSRREMASYDSQSAVKVGSDVATDESLIWAVK